MKAQSLWKEILVACSLSPTNEQLASLARYRDWLATEAVAGGGIAPGDLERIDERHIADSLLFLRVLSRSDTILDIGCGVGLPGIPLAIALPGHEIVCLDRSGRRIDLVRRAIAVLGIQNVTVIQGDIRDHTGRYDSVVSRATIPPRQFRPILFRTLLPGGVAVLGGSWKEDPSTDGFVTEEIGSEILGQPVWTLIMTAK